MLKFACYPCSSKQHKQQVRSREGAVDKGRNSRAKQSLATCTVDALCLTPASYSTKSL